MDFRTPRNLQAITAGTWLVPPGDDAAPITGFSFDTRTLQRGDLFLAIRSDTSDGHQFVEKAIERGAAMLIVESEISNLKSQIVPILLVPSTVAALQQIAAAWRTILDNHNVKVIAVTGSNGKTTTRNMIHCALSSTLHGTQSPKSFNNHLGVPLTLLAASAQDDFIVAEVGTNHPGEIAALAKILRPHIAVITNIGTAHIGMFGSKDAIAAEKSSLFQFIEPDGTAIMRSSEIYAKSWRESISLSVRVITFGRDDAAQVKTTSPPCTDERGLHFTLDSGAVIDLPLLGEHNIDNALAAIAVARTMGVKDDVAAAALSRLSGVEMRMQIVEIGHGEAASGGEAEPAVTVINDCYNANPDSMTAGLVTLASLPVARPVRRVAILGDMRELGDETVSAHRAIGSLLRQLGSSADAEPVNGDGATGDLAETTRNQPKNIDIAILIGADMKHAADEMSKNGAANRVTYFAHWSDDLPGQVTAQLRQGDVVLLKASRGMQLERLLPAMRLAFES